MCDGKRRRGPAWPILRHDIKAIWGYARPRETPKTLVACLVLTVVVAAAWLAVLALLPVVLLSTLSVLFCSVGLDGGDALGDRRRRGSATPVAGEVVAGGLLPGAARRDG